MKNFLSIDRLTKGKFAAPPLIPRKRTGNQCLRRKATCVFSGLERAHKK